MEKKTFIKGVVAGILITVLGINGFQIIKLVINHNEREMHIEEKIGAISNLLNKLYVEELDFEKMEEGIYAGLVDSLGDPYTSYMSKAELTSFMEDTDGSFYGIGVQVTMDKIDGSLLIISPIEGTPAAEAGILAQDKIIKVDGKDVSGADMDQAVSMMKGKEGTEVTVTIYRTSTGEVLDFVIKRAEINMDSVAYEMLENQIGYIKITQFRKNTYDQFKKAYDNLTSQGQKGLIIDVRNNPGGLVDTVEKIGDLLVPEGTLVYTIDKEGNREDFVSDAKQIQVPLCVLVNGSSASASEILSGAVQDMGVGKLVGTQTFGKGLVQGLYSLSDGSGVKITIQKYYTPKGVCIQGTGITPDYIVELPEEYEYSLTIPRDQDTQMQKAIEVIQKEIQ